MSASRKVELVSGGLAADHIIALTQKLLDSIANRDWATYEPLTDSGLTCIEPETGGTIVLGYPFHKFFFDALKSDSKLGPAPLTTIASPTVQLLGASRDVAVLSYTRLVQTVDKTGAVSIVRAAETRVWEKKGSQFKHVHFHRSKL